MFFVFILVNEGVPWTEEEHKLFLLGLQQVGKGDWRGISRNFVKTRTPTQVASHAQKYFLRRHNQNRRRRRSSLFDITTDTVIFFFICKKIIFLFFFNIIVTKIKITLFSL
jgi:SHAQKYF class myb-like DNA-binding protein